MMLVFAFGANDQYYAIPEHIDPEEGNDHFLVNLGDWSGGKHFVDAKIFKRDPNDCHKSAKNAPEDYKKNILELLNNQEMVNGIFEIAKAMDDDLGRGATQNQDRARNVIQYIKDNRIAFEF